MEKQVFSNKLRTGVAFLFLCVSLFVFTAQSFSAKNVPCKDCGTPENCQNGNGLNSGYSNCIPRQWKDVPGVQYSGCDVSGWGQCS